MTILKKYSRLFSVIVLVASIYIGFTSVLPSIDENEDPSKEEFSLDNALIHLKEISKEPHFTGSKGHRTVRDYIVLELENMGLEVSIQEQMAMDPKHRATAKTKNILAKISGSQKGKSLLLLSHYDSEPHSSLGASDAGSGVVTILEGVRAFLAKNKRVKNDIIICITDAEEIDLLGAVAFVNKHPWAKNVGLVLNFEARGSGGPSYMLLETNGGNKKLIEAFSNANTPYPLASSLMYSIYKMLPNDTDLTIFRQDGNINGFNFAFIGDHFDYHTAQDSYERMDLTSLRHQASYLMPLMHYFANNDLSQLDDNTDLVYFNFPVVGLIYYPFSWVRPMFYFSCLIFFLILIVGLKRGKLSLIGMLRGIIPFILSLILTIILAIYGWKLLLNLYPQYADIHQGFTHNGYYYIIGFVSLTLACCFWIYRRFFQNISSQDLLVFPIFCWILINAGISFYLEGGGFFLLPVLILIFMLAILVFSKPHHKHIFLFTLISIPLLIIITPWIKMVPVGLGLKMLVGSTVITVLLFGVLIPLIQQYEFYKTAAISFLFLGIVGLVGAAFLSNYNEDRKQPNSIFYIQDVEKKTAYWASFNSQTDVFTEQFLGENPEVGSFDSNTMLSKYNSGIQLYNITTIRDFKKPMIRIISDSIIDNQREIKLRLRSNRNAYKFELISKIPIRFRSFSINGESLKTDKTGDYIFSLRSGSVMSYFITEVDENIEMEFIVDKNQLFDMDLYESKYDLLSNDQFEIHPRSDHMMPMPFVLNDATVIKSNLKF